MKLTRSQLKRIIKEAILKEDVNKQVKEIQEALKVLNSLQSLEILNSLQSLEQVKPYLGSDNQTKLTNALVALKPLKEISQDISKELSEVLMSILAE